MKPRRVALLSIVLLVTVLSLLATPIAGARSAGSKRQVSYNGVSFTYDTTLGNVTARTLQEMKAGPQTPLWLVHPQHVRFDFGNAPRDEFDLLAPAIYVYPTGADYAALDPDPRNQIWQPRLDSMRKLLDERPPLDPISTDISRGDPLPMSKAPFLPPINAGRQYLQYLWKQKYMAFGTGSGVRYVTRFTQNEDWIVAEGTVYTFQGLTADGRYYVSVVFPTFLAASAGLAPPAPGESPEAYNPGAIQKLNAAPDAQYSPQRSPRSMRWWPPSAYRAAMCLACPVPACPLA